MFRDDLLPVYWNSVIMYITFNYVQGRPAPYVYWNSEPEIKELKDAREKKQKTNLTYSTTSTVSKLHVQYNQHGKQTSRTVQLAR